MSEEVREDLSVMEGKKSSISESNVEKMCFLGSTAVCVVRSRTDMEGAG